MMFKKDGAVEKRLRRIVKGEEANIKLLEKQEQELIKAVEDNGRVLDSRLNKPSSHEIKLDREITRLRDKIDKLNTELEQQRTDREQSAEPYRLMDDELKEKLKIVRLQLETVRGLRDRTFSSSSVNFNGTGLEISISQIGLTEGGTTSAPSTPSEAYPPIIYSSARQNQPAHGQRNPPPYTDTVTNPFEN